MQKKYKKKKNGTHEGPKVLKNDEHMKAHVLKKREKEQDHDFKIKTRERSYLQKKYSFSLPFSTHMHILI